MWTRTYRIMIDSFTTCSYSASIWARICTFLVNTSHLWWTLRVNNTFWATTRWFSNIRRQTWTNSLIVNFSTLWIWSTRRRYTWVCSRWRRHWNFFTREEWISIKTSGACAEWYVVCNFTNSVRSTSTNTRIYTLISKTRKFQWAFVVAFAFSSTPLLLIKWISFISFEAIACSCTIILSAFCV